MKPFRWAGGWGAYCAISVVVTAIYYNIRFSSGHWDFLWYCNAAFIVLALAFFRRSPGLGSAVLVSAPVAQFPWMWGDVMYLLGRDLYARTAWRRENIDGLGFFLDLNYHWMVLPLALLAVWHFGYSRRAFRNAAMIFLTLLIITYFLTPPRMNINCVFYPPDVLQFDEELLNYYGGRHFLGRLAFYVTIVFALHQLLLRLPFLKKV